MINILSQSGKTTYGVNSYIVDTEKDIDMLPVDISAGSTVFVVETQVTKMLNSKKEWVQIFVSTPPISGSTILDGGDA